MTTTACSVQAIRARRRLDETWATTSERRATPPSPAPTTAVASAVGVQDHASLNRDVENHAKPVTAMTPTRHRMYGDFGGSWCRSLFYFGCEAAMMCIITALALIYVFVFVGYNPYGHSSSRLTHADGTRVSFGGTVWLL